MNHLTSEQIQEYIDKALTGDVDLHLRTCSVCQAKIRALQTIDRSLRSVSLEQPSSQFTERVMRELGITTSPSFAWLLFRNLAPLLALTVVVGVVIFALKLGGVFETSELQETGRVSQDFYHQIGGGLSGAVHGFNNWLSRYLSFAFPKNAYGLTSFVFVFLGAVALLDKYLIMPRMRRKVL